MDLVSTTLADDDPGRPWYHLLTWLIAGVVCLPIWIVSYPPLVDYPNHLARCYIFDHLRDQPFRERYVFDAALIPSLGTDVIIDALQAVGCDVQVAGKIFLSLTVLLYYLGGHLLGRAVHGRPTWLALGTALFCYHSMFFYGYTNYSLCLGTYLTALACWVSWDRHGGVFRLLLFQVLVFLCFFAHLAGYLLLGGAVFLMSVRSVITAAPEDRRRRLGRYLLGMLPLVPPAVIFLVSRPESADAGAIVWSTLADKVIGALCLVRTYSFALDGTYLVLLLGWLLALVLSAVPGPHGKRWPMNGGLLLVGLACVCMFVVAPKESRGGGAPVDARFLPAAAPLLLLAPAWTFRRRRALLLLCGLIGLIGLRTGVIVGEWRPQSQNLASQTALFEALPLGAKLYPIVGVAEDATERKRARCLFHAAHYATVLRDAYVPELLAHPGHQPIRYRHPPKVPHLVADSLPPVRDVDWDSIFREFDYVWGYRLPPEYDELLRQRCQVVVAGASGVIYRKYSE